jgi:hypothetical protein
MNSNELNFNSGNGGVQTKTQDLRQLIRDTHKSNVHIAKRNELDCEDVELQSYRTTIDHESTSAGREFQIITNRPLSGSNNCNIKRTLKPRHRGSLTPVRKSLLANKENNNNE